MNWLTRRRLRTTCPRCGLRALARIQHREGLLGDLFTLTRYCANCAYSDGVVRALDPDRRLERDAATAAAGAYVLVDR